jgi:hypothetical protein
VQTVRTCAICGIDPRTHKVGSNAHMDICYACRADPANVDWLERDTAAPSDCVDALSPQCSLADLQMKPPMDVSPLIKQVLSMVLMGKVNVRRVTGWTVRAMTTTEIADHLQCSQQYVSRIRRKYLIRH